MCGVHFSKHYTFVARTICVLLWPVLLFILCGPVVRAQGHYDTRAVERRIEEAKTRYRIQLGKRNAAQSRLGQVRGDVRLAEDARGVREQEMDAALRKFRETQQLSERRPDLPIPTDSERQAYAQAKAAYEAAERNVASQRAFLAPAQVAMQREDAALKATASELEGLVQELENIRFERFRQQIEREEVVIVQAEQSCGSLSISDCRLNALNLARQRAIESVSAILVDASTEITNYRVTRDQVRSRVRGIIVREEVLESRLVGESGYFYRIRATVRGQLPPGYRPQPAATFTLPTDPIQPATPPVLMSEPLPPPAPETTTVARRSSWPLWTGLVLVAAAGAGYSAYTEGAKKAKAQADDARANDDTALYANAKDKAKQAESIGTGSAVLGGIGVALVMYYLVSEPSDHGASIRVAHDTESLILVAAKQGGLRLDVQYRW